MGQAETILSLFKQNEEGAFKLLFETYHDTLLLFANQMLDDPEAAKDVVRIVLSIFGYTAVSPIFPTDWNNTFFNPSNMPPSIIFVEKKGERNIILPQKKMSKKT